MIENKKLYLILLNIYNMGNIISDENYNLKQLTINDFITDWAKHDFDNGLTYNTSNDIYKYELLKKRGCCTQNNTMNIALPEINSDGGINGDFNYTPVNILLSQPLTKEVANLCSLGDIHPSDSITSVTKKDYLYNFDTNKKMTPACVDLYGDSVNSPSASFCKLVASENMLMFGNSSDSNMQLYYGKYGTISKNNRPDMLLNNVFFDCNCKNSVAYGPAMKNVQIKLENTGTTAVNPDIMAQLFDLRCSTLSNNAYKQILHDTPACIQINDISNATIDSSSVLNVQNTCNVTVDEKNVKTLAPPDQPNNYVEPQKAPELPNSNYNNFHNHPIEETTTSPSTLDLDEVPPSYNIPIIVSIVGICVIVFIFILLKFLL